MKYTDMQLSQPVLKSIERMGFTEPTLIQTKSIPLILSGKDILGQSETGSGKTAAFGIPIAEKCEKGKGIQAVIISPTRELVEQIASVMKKITRDKKLHVMTVYGGVAIQPQIDNLKIAEIVVATPGRLLDHLERGTLNFTPVKIAVLDEADKMFEMGFIEDIERILASFPKSRQTLLYSATIRSDMQTVVDKHMRHPESLKTKDHVEHTMLTQECYAIDRRRKLSLLVHLLRKEKPKLAMVFCATRRETDFVERNLKVNNIKAAALHGGLTQAKRNKVTADFRKANIHVLAATDVAARGLDINDVTHIINYSIPSTPKEYIHRIGRTARMGNKGKAINLIDESDHDNMRNVEKDSSLNLEVMDPPHLEQVKLAGRVNDRRGLPRGRQGMGPRRGAPRRDSGYGRQSQSSPRYENTREEYKAPVFGPRRS